VSRALHDNWVSRPPVCHPTCMLVCYEHRCRVLFSHETMFSLILFSDQT
jgi:hypothetical protein